MLFLRHSGLTDKDLQQICFLLRAEAGPHMNKTLKVIDLSYNSFSGKAVSHELSSVFETNRTLEYVGIAKNNLETADVIPIIKSFGRFPFPTD